MPKRFWIYPVTVQIIFDALAVLTKSCLTWDQSAVSGFREPEYWTFDGRFLQVISRSFDVVKRIYMYARSR